MLPSWRQCRFFVTINGVSYKKVLPYRGAHQRSFLHCLVRSFLLLSQVADEAGRFFVN